MNRRSFIKGLIALASAPAIGKYVNVFKTEGARKGIENVASQGVDFFNSVIKKVMDEGSLVKEEDRISTFKHPDRPDIVVDVIKQMELVQYILILMKVVKQWGKFKKLWMKLLKVEL